MSLEARWRLRVQDILDAVQRIATYVDEMSAEAFYDDQRTIDAVVRNIEIIGEAARHVPAEVQGRSRGIPWAQMRGMRNVVIHEYDAVDVELVWETVTNDLPPLVAPLQRLLGPGEGAPSAPSS